MVWLVAFLFACRCLILWFVFFGGSGGGMCVSLFYSIQNFAFSHTGECKSLFWFPHELRVILESEHGSSCYLLQHNTITNK